MWERSAEYVVTDNKAKIEKAEILENILHLIVVCRDLMTDAGLSSIVINLCFH